ncbi:MAG: hypothetical protein GX557_07605 [Chloroflexi bacterium]|nr:hypothetical protein [Chloroflexota bacterium]
MEQWEYDISVHTLAQIVSSAEADTAEGRVLFCGAEGRCFFDDAPNPYMQAITEMLNERGLSGWILVQTVLRQKDMICFWRRPVAK